MTAAIDRLRDEARTYDLNGTAEQERGNDLAAAAFKAAALALYSVANALELEEAA